MRKLLICLIVLSLTGISFAEITGWWGVVSFRERFEETVSYKDYTFNGEPGEELYSDANTKSRVGYMFGFRMNITDYIAAGMTFRSGLGSVMWQDIGGENKFTPGVQEAYINWNTPYALLELGKIHQEGTALWDLYAASLQSDWRLFDPRDGVFSDRISALSGARLTVPIEIFKVETDELYGHKLPQRIVKSELSITPRYTFHADYVSGYRRDYPDTLNQDINGLDWYTYLIGLNINYKSMLFEANVDFDSGIPHRKGDKKVQDSQDSVYVGEDLWGITGSIKSPLLRNTSFSIGYAYNWRDSVFKADYLDFRLSTEPFQFFDYFDIQLPEKIQTLNFTFRYQLNEHEHQFGNYKGSKVIRDAYHYYFNIMLWDLDFQPRIILFKTEIDPTGIDLTDVDSEQHYRYVVKKQRSMLRMELTATVRF